MENLIRSWALGRSNWLFAGSLRSGQRAANIKSLVQAAKLNGHKTHAYLKDVQTRLPRQKASQIHKFLPQHWKPVDCSPTKGDGRALTKDLPFEVTPSRAAQAIVQPSGGQDE